jgi:hypothetical protein
MDLANEELGLSVVPEREFGRSRTPLPLIESSLLKFYSSVIASEGSGLRIAQARLVASLSIARLADPNAVVIVSDMHCIRG